MADTGPDEMTAGGTPDDRVLPFSTVKSKALGRLVRLGPMVDEMLGRHDYPDTVNEVLGEAIALAAMLGTTLKFDGDLIIQTKTDGPINMLVVNYATPGRIRAHASFDATRIATASSKAQTQHGELLGSGYLALTIDPGRGMERYQGVVALEGQDLASAAHQYFRQSEQLPTYIRLAVARHQVRGERPDSWQWRAGGLMVQHVTPVGGHDLQDDQEEFLLGEEDDDWRRVQFLAETVEDHEILDPMLAPERLLYRLFHEEGVRAADSRPLESFCKCSQVRIQSLLRSFKSEELTDLRDDDGNIVVTCEFCNRTYRFEEPATG